MRSSLRNRIERITGRMSGTGHFTVTMPLPPGQARKENGKEKGTFLPCRKPALLTRPVVVRRVTDDPQEPAAGPLAAADAATRPARNAKRTFGHSSFPAAWL
jgi:hypothetical protein